MLLAAGDSEEKAQAIFDSMAQAASFDGEIEQYTINNPYESTGITAEPIETEGTTTEIEATDSDGNTISGGSVHIPGWTYKKTEDTSTGSDEETHTAYRVKSNSLHKSYGGGIKVNNSSGGNKGSGSGNKGSGSGSKAGSKKKTKEHKTSSIKKDRYHNIKEKIEDTTDALDRLNDASDRA